MQDRSKRFINRELSWLEFNQRVLEEALRNDRPLLERLKFLAISAANLDEFFMVRVGGLTMLRRSNHRKRDIAGLTPTQQLQAIRKRVLRMIQDQYRLLNQELLPGLAAEGIRPMAIKALSPSQRNAFERYFDDQVLPLLTPLAVDLSRPELSPVPALQLIVAAELNEDQIVIVPVPDTLPRRVEIPDGEGYTFTFIEELIALFINRLFPDEKIDKTGCFRVTRNGDIAVQEEDAIDLAGEMEEVLAARKNSETVRLEIGRGTSLNLRRHIKTLCAATTSTTFRSDGPLDLSAFMDLAFLPQAEHLRDTPWPDQLPHPKIDPRLSMFENIAANDLLLYHPYESFEPVLRLLEEAAIDPDVIAIKQVLYRTASNSRVVDALIRAAENGKHVTVLIELKARFDEARNLTRADELHRAGVQVVYGVHGLKTHAKIALIVRREDGHLRRYCHFGTGNYNESTAKLYTDTSYLTCAHDFGSDASLFFNCVTGRSRLLRFTKLIPAPTSMKRRIIQLIESEAARAAQGEPARIIAKTNSLQDEEIIEALYAASSAGVDIKLNVRGICCLKPGKRKEAKNIQVVSYIDRYLEHARIFYFHQGGSPQLFISSADWMTRNLDKRVELLVPVEASRPKQKLIKILNAFFDDNCQAFDIQPDGTGIRRTPIPKQKHRRAQQEIAQFLKRNSSSRKQKDLQILHPHIPNDIKA